jgi:hypothetical protein
MIKCFINYSCDSDLLMRWFSLILLWQWPVNEMIESISGMPVLQYGDESSRVLGPELVQDVPVFRFDWCKVFSRTHYDVFEGYVYPRLKTTDLGGSTLLQCITVTVIRPHAISQTPCVWPYFDMKTMGSPSRGAELPSPLLSSSQ